MGEEEGEDVGEVGVGVGAGDGDGEWVRRRR